MPAGKLGDVVCTTPVFFALRKHLPNTRIVIEDTTGINEKILCDSGLVDEYVKAEKFFPTVRKLRALSIDAACLTGPDFFMLACLYCAGVPLIVAPHVQGGFCPQQTRLYRLLLRFAITVPHLMGHYAPRERLRVLEPLGIKESDTIKRLGYSDTARKNVKAFFGVHGLAEKKFVVISPSAGNKIKNWPPERFARVAEHLAARGMPVVVIGSARDKEEVSSMMAALENPDRIINTFAQFSVDELKALIARAGLFVSVDTGPLYIAEAFGVPTVDIVGPIDEREQPPIGPMHAVVVPERRRPALYVMNARVYDQREAQRQGESIQVDRVVAACEKAIRGNYRPTADELDKRQMRFNRALRLFMQSPKGDPHVLIAEYRHLYSMHALLAPQLSERTARIPHVFDYARLGQVDPTYRVIRTLQKEITSIARYTRSVLIQGSFATEDFVPGWSDLDSMVVLNDRAFDSADDLVRVKRVFLRVGLLCYFVDPLAHHQLFFATDFDLGYYPQTLLPLAAYEEGMVLTGSRALSFRVRPDQEDREEKFDRLRERLRRAAAEFQRIEAFEWKQILADAMLVPSYLLQSIGIYVYKRESFVLARHKFPTLDFGPIDEATVIMRRWQGRNLVRLFPYSTIWLPYRLAARLISIARIPSTRSRPTESPVVVQHLAESFYNEYARFNTSPTIDQNV